MQNSKVEGENEMSLPASSPDTISVNTQIIRQNLNYAEWKYFSSL